MSMSIHAIGFRPADKKWHKFKAVWNVCEDAGTSIPDAVLEYFDHEDPARL